MSRQTAPVVVALGLIITAGVTAQQPANTDQLIATLQRVGERVEQYFARAQSIVCLELVRLQPLGSGLGAEGFARNVQSELRLSWDPTSGDTDDAPEAKAVRQVIKVNGHAPRKNDHDNCTTPEQNSTETQPLSMLLPGQRVKYAFSLVGPGKLDGRAVLMLDFKERKPVTVAVSEVPDNEDCVSYDLDGGMAGRLWVDPQTFDVLRLDQRLAGLVDVRLPRKMARRPGVNEYWTVERFDSSIRFKPVAFQEPTETLILPVSMSQLRVTRGAGTPRLRTTTEYSSYRRFLTGARIVKDPP
ncbi:MAG: hypothetical protein ABI665_17750 [Vicinamibacterales bacterium]